MKSILISTITLYQNAIGPFLKPSCKFYPSCSEYAKEAIGKHGAAAGSRLSLLRILRCHPWQENRIDPVP